MFDKDIKGLFLVHITKDKYELIECVDIFKNFNIDFNKIEL
jgi:hypothetical protein